MGTLVDKDLHIHSPTGEYFLRKKYCHIEQQWMNLEDSTPSEVRKLLRINPNEFHMVGVSKTVELWR